MKILIDMNLSPIWVEMFSARGIESVHWSTLGPPNASDSEILQFARERGCVVFTHDLDFGAILANTSSRSPSVVQVRTQDVLSTNIADTTSRVIKDYERQLRDGALITIDEARARIRILPLK